MLVTQLGVRTASLVWVALWTDQCACDPARCEDGLTGLAVRCLPREQLTWV